MLNSCRLDIALDLPPPAAVLRRAAAQGPGPAFDMGPLIPGVHNPNQADAQRQREFINGGPQRPPTQVGPHPSLRACMLQGCSKSSLCYAG